MKSSQPRWTTAVVLGGALVALLSLSPNEAVPSSDSSSKEQSNQLAQAHEQPVKGPEVSPQVAEPAALSDLAQRRATFRDLIISNPEKALAEAISFEAYQKLSTEEKAQHETPIRGRARIETQIVCYVGQRSELRHFLKHEGKELRVYGLDRPYPEEVHYEGVAVDHVAALYVDAASASTAPTVSAARTAAAARKVLLIPVSLSDKKLSITTAEMQRNLDIARNFIELNSRYRLTLETTIADPVELAGTVSKYETTGNKEYDLHQDAANAVKAVGKYDPMNYDTVAVLFPNLNYVRDGIVWSGIGSMPGRNLWLNGTVHWSTLAHELGHNLGLGHARFLQPKSKEDLLNDVTVVEYGNIMDQMGRGSNLNDHFSAIYKDKLQWLDTSEVGTITTSGVYRLYPHDTTTAEAGYRVLKLNKKSSSTAAYYIELRGANVNVIRPASDGFSSELIDNEPLTENTSYEAHDTALVAGNLFRDTTNELSAVVTAVSSDPENQWADIRINIGTPPDAEVPVITQITGTANKAPSTNTLTAQVTNAGGRTTYIKWKIDGNPIAFGAGSTLDITIPIGGAIRVTATPTDGYRQGSPVSHTLNVTDPLLTWTKVRDSAGSITTAGGRIFQNDETSTDGCTWSPMVDANGGTFSLQFVAYVKGQYIAANSHYTGATEIFTSADGITWTSRYVTSTVKSPTWIFATDTLVLIADAQNHLLVCGSPLSFEEITLSDISRLIAAKVFNGKIYLLAQTQTQVLSGYTTYASHLYTSADGKTWTNSHPSFATHANRLYVIGDYLMTVTGSDTVVQVAKDGVLQYVSAHTVVSGVIPFEIAQLPNRVFGTSGANFIASTNGTDWAQVPSPFTSDTIPFAPKYFNGRAYRIRSDGLYRSDLLVSTPSITQAEKNYSLRIGKTYQLSVTPTERSDDLTVQWFKDGVALEGQASLTLNLAVSAAAAGRYSVRLTNAAGSTTANVATITTSDQPSGRLVNLSIRGKAGTGENTLIAGFVISGADSDAMPLLIRGIGPSLKQFGVNNAISHTAMTLFSRTGTPLRSNSAWAGHWVLRDAMKRLGAFELDRDSQDAATYELLDGPLYTVGATPVDEVTGEALLELYEDTGVLTSTTLVNISARGSITKDAPMIAGFVIAGDAPFTVLIRGIGPSLKPFGVNAAAEDTVLQVFDSAGTPIAGAYSDDWASNGEAQLKEAFKATGAFELPSTSKDAAMLVTLNPGLYTVHLTSKDSATSIGLIEVYRTN